MLREKLNEDLKNSLKQGNQQKRLVLGMVLSAIKNREFEKRNKLSKTEKDLIKLEEASKLNEEEIIEVIGSEVKKRKEAAESYKNGGRADLAQKETDESVMLMTYLPEQMSEEEIRNEVVRTIATIGAKDIKEMGKVIGAVIAKIKGKADAQIVSRVVKQELSK